jgi:hypothetical protein
MSWIKENKFLAGLVGGTLLGVVALYFVGAKGSSRYTTAKEEFDAAASDATNIERLPVYPTAENRDGKRKALDEYKKSAESLQAAFEGFRPKEIKNVSPQEFTNNLRAVNAEVRKAFEDSGTTVPDPFFCGFESYKTNLARGNSTGILNYQLDSIRKLMVALSKSGATELKNLHRPLLPEEDGKDFTPGAADVARRMPLEITFQGPEKAVRAFVSSLTKAEDQYVVIRSLRIANAKKEPPRSADAKFEKPAAEKAGAENVFGGGFVLPGEEPKAEEAKPAEAAVVPPPADSSRILAQVLGNEEVQVFLRLDLMQFLPAKKLP